MLCIQCYTKNGKRLDLSMYIFKTTNFVRFFILCTHNTNNFILKICMLVGYTFDNIQICFHNIL
jgi:hypothetical protein